MIDGYQCCGLRMNATSGTSSLPCKGWMEPAKRRFKHGREWWRQFTCNKCGRLATDLA